MMRLHSLLQFFGQYYLYRKYGCRFAATEVENPQGTVDLYTRYGDFTEEEKEINKADDFRHRSVYDVLGVRENNGTEVVGIEVKTSRQDLNKGYCLAGCHRNFVLIPADLYSYARERIPSRIGILLYMPENLRDAPSQVSDIDYAIKCKRGAQHRDIQLNTGLLVDRIMTRNNSQIRFYLLKGYLERMDGRGK